MFATLNVPPGDATLTVDGNRITPAQLASYLLAFVVSAWTSPAGEALSPSGDPVEYLLLLTLGRLFLHLAPLVIVLALLASPPLHARPAPATG